MNNAPAQSDDVAAAMSTMFAAGIVRKIDLRKILAKLDEYQERASAGASEYELGRVRAMARLLEQRYAESVARSNHAIKKVHRAIDERQQRYKPYRAIVRIPPRAPRSMRRAGRAKRARRPATSATRGASDSDGEPFPTSGGAS